MENKLLNGLKITVIGGDRRELVLIKELVKEGARVLLVGYDDLSSLPETYLKTDLKTGLTNTDAIILPMPGVNENGEVKAIFTSKKLVLDKENLELVLTGTPILLGVASDYLKQLAKELSLNIIETAELSEIAIYNSIPTAEAALEIAIREREITLHGSNSLVLGFGNIGSTLARMLKGIGAQVWVTARKMQDLARITEQGYRPLNYDETHEIIGEMDFIFNTVPVLVLAKAQLEAVKTETLIIDLASMPGGIDFLAASELGIRTIHALGLPGKTASLTAGKILGKAYPKIILDQIGIPFELGVSK